MKKNILGIALFFVFVFVSSAGAVNCITWLGGTSGYSESVGVQYINCDYNYVAGLANCSHPDKKMRLISFPTGTGRMYRRIDSNNHCEFQSDSVYFGTIPPECAAEMSPKAYSFNYPFVPEGWDTSLQYCSRFYWIGSGGDYNGECTGLDVQYTSVNGSQHCIDMLDPAEPCLSETCPFVYQAWDSVMCECQNKYCAPPSMLDYESGNCVICQSPEVYNTDTHTCELCPAGFVKNSEGVCQRGPDDIEYFKSGYKGVEKFGRQQVHKYFGRGGYEKRGD